MVRDIVWGLLVWGGIIGINIIINKPKKDDKDPAEDEECR